MKVSLVSGLVVLLVLSGAIYAGLMDPAVDNASFEDGALGEGDWDFNVGAPWGETGGTYLENNAITASDPTPYGDKSVRIGWSGAVYQEIGTWSADTNYEVTVWIGQRGTAGSWLVGELWGGGTSGYGGPDVSLWDNVGATWVDYHWFNVADLGGSLSGDVSWTFNTSAFNADGLTEGAPMWLRLAADGAADMQIDNVRVTPEPATLALLSLGGVALLRRRKQS